MKVLRNGFQALRDCRGPFALQFPPLSLQVYRKIFCKALVCQKKWCWVRQKTGFQVQQVGWRLHLPLLYLIHSIFFCTSPRLCLCHLDLCYPSLDNGTKMYPPTHTHKKRAGKISKITVRAVHRWEFAVFMSGWKIGEQDWAIWAFLLSHPNPQW